MRSLLLSKSLPNPRTLPPTLWKHIPSLFEWYIQSPKEECSRSHTQGIINPPEHAAPEQHPPPTRPPALDVSQPAGSTRSPSSCTRLDVGWEEHLRRGKYQQCPG